MENEENMSDNEVLRSIDPREKLILYGAGALDKPLKSQVKLQNLMFLGSKALPDIIGKELNFIAHKKGPYSEEVGESASSLEDMGFISVRDCALTESGAGMFKNLGLKDPVKGVIDDYKEIITRLNEDELLTFVYVTYPEYQLNSEEWDRLRPNRVKAAANMLKKDTIGFSKAVEISGIDSGSFIDYLKSKNIRWRSVKLGL